MTEKLPSLPSDVLAEVFHLSHLQAFFVCNFVLPAYLKYLSKTSALEDVDFAFNAFIHLLCLAAYIKTGITSGLEPDLGAVTAPDLSNLKNSSLALTTLLWMCCVLPPCLETVPPRNTNRSTSFIPCPFTSTASLFRELFAAVYICPH